MCKQADSYLALCHLQAFFSKYPSNISHFKRSPLFDNPMSMKTRSNFICYALLIAIAGFSFSKSSAQTSQWAWIKGSNTVYQSGTYGAMATPGAANSPGSRYGSVSWKDNAGNMWLFGGYGNSGSMSGYLNDLWKLDVSTGNWAWMKGSNNAVSQNGAIYGTQGTAATANVPGGRYGSITWVDNAGNLWLLGGYGYAATTYGELNDLWKYNITTGNWTWMKGSDVSNMIGVYGTMGVAAAANTPGARYGGAAWKDNGGNLWLFSGEGFATNTNGAAILNDLWKYDLATNNWTWMKGSNTLDQTGNYGMIGVATTSNMPGGRTLPASWTDNSGNFWLFGGDGMSAANGRGYLNDLWKYNVATGNWTWMKGSDVGYQNGTYGIIGTAATPNNPGGRFGSVSFKDSYGNLWMLGGYGMDAAGNLDNMNDLWRFDMSTGYWAWVKGSDIAAQPGAYGSQGIAATNNTPGARYFDVSWTDNSGNFWLWGGYGSDAANNGGMLNDLWKFSPPATILPLSLTSFSATRQNSVAMLSWSVSQEQGIASYNIECSANGRDYVSIGAVTSLGNTTKSRTYNFTDFKPLQGANYYRIKIMEKDNQQSYSDVRLLNFGTTTSIILYPNPVKDKTTITGLEAGMYLKLINNNGQVVLTQKVTGNIESIAAKALAAGSYRVQVYGTTGQLLTTTVLVKE